MSTDCEKYSNKNILRSAGKISKSPELVGSISEKWCRRRFTS